MFRQKLTDRCLLFKTEKPGKVVHGCNPSTRRVEAGGLLQYQNQPKQHSKFKTSLEYKQTNKQKDRYNSINHQLTHR